MTLSWRKLHWGESPVAEIDVAWPSNEPAEAVAEVRACSYLTSKEGDGGSVYRHEFSRVDGRWPFLLRLAPRGSWSTPKLPKRIVALGYAIDLELADGSLVVPTHHIIVTSVTAGSTGHPVGIAALHPHLPVWAIECRTKAGRYVPHVTPHGIEA